MTKKKKRIALIDGDIVVFQCLVKSMHEMLLTTDDGGRFIHKFLNVDQAIHTIKTVIDNIAKDLSVSKSIFCYTDSKGENFRKKIYPAYKCHRSKFDDNRPLGIDKVKEFMSEHYICEQWDNLEADDVLGILATDPEYYPDCEKIIVSEDKDLRTIPSLLYNPRKDAVPILITENEANRYLAYQCLAGDATDGYKGCVGIGMKTATDLIENKIRFTPCYKLDDDGVERIRWKKEVGKADRMWQTIKTCYLKNGLKEEEALANARCARILRKEDYNYETKKIKLFNPSLL